ncbi:MAG: hypothetical protein Fur0042_11140 [Cyanophyceae cyanobacterium]
MDVQGLKDGVRAIAAKRPWLLDLLEKPEIGSLRLDVNQAIEEIDDLMDEFYDTFPEERNGDNGSGTVQGISIS